MTANRATLMRTALSSNLAEMNDQELSDMLSTLEDAWNGYDRTTDYYAAVERVCVEIDRRIGL